MNCYEFLCFRKTKFKVPTPASALWPNDIGQPPRWLNWCDLVILRGQFMKNYLSYLHNPVLNREMNQLGRVLHAKGFHHLVFVELDRPR